jgi:hypothetical protein
MPPEDEKCEDIGTPCACSDCACPKPYWNLELLSNAELDRGLCS